MQRGSCTPRCSRIDERSFDVRPQRLGAALDLARGEGGQTLDDDLDGRADDGRTERRDAVPRQRSGNVLERRVGVGRRGEIDAARTVHLQIDQTRRDPAVLHADIDVEWPFARLDRRNPARADLDARRRQLRAAGEHAPPQINDDGSATAGPAMF